jgi:acyl carrier protein phosphodiesterase
MNFLGHFYLSGSSESLLIGNYIADMVKGKRYLEYPEPIARGIIMHRHIDTFTDRHPVFRSSKKRLTGQYGLYSGVIVDMFYDHFLAKNWHRYSDVPLSAFADHSYRILEKHTGIFPEKGKVLFRFMKTNNWLLSYAETSGIQRSLQGLAKRTRFHSGMETAVKNLHKHYKKYESEFTYFFNDAVNHFCHSFKTDYH